MIRIFMPQDSRRRAGITTLLNCQKSKATRFFGQTGSDSRCGPSPFHGARDYVVYRDLEPFVDVPDVPDTVLDADNSGEYTGPQDRPLALRGDISLCENLCGSSPYYSRPSSSPMPMRIRSLSPP